MDTERTRALYAQHMRQQATFASSVREEATGIVRYVSQNAPRTNIRYTSLTDEAADAVIRREVARAQSQGHEFEWTLFEGDTPPDMKTRLVKHGFKIGEVEAVMVLDLQHLPPHLAQPTTQDIRRVTDPDEMLLVLRDVADAVFESDLAGQMQRDLLENAEASHLYAAYIDGKPVSTARLEHFGADNPFAGLYGGSTLAAYRGYGLYTALIATRARDAHQRGVRYLTVDASPMSRPILQKIGFTQVTQAWPCDLTSL